MKKIILLIAVMLATFSSCDMNEAYEPKTNDKGVTTQAISLGYNTHIEKVTFEGHDYLVFKESVYCGWSVSVVHSESCPCHNKDAEK